MEFRRVLFRSDVAVVESLDSGGQVYRVAGLSSVAIRKGRLQAGVGDSCQPRQRARRIRWAPRRTRNLACLVAWARIASTARRTCTHTTVPRVPAIPTAVVIATAISAVSTA